MDQDALDLMRTAGIVGAIIQPGRALRLVGRNLLGVVNCTTIEQMKEIAVR